MSALDSMLRRQSRSKVGQTAPTHFELLRLVEAAGSVADHSSLRPWRLIEIRGEARDRVGSALGVAQDASGSSTPKAIAKTQRAPLLIAIVAVHRPSEKVSTWEQDAVAAGVGHSLSLLLDEAGWGVIWRTGHQTRADQVRQAHGLALNEHLLGWLYVGDVPGGPRELRRRRINPSDFVTEL